MSNAITTNLKKFNYEKYASLIALIVLFVISSILSPYFLQVQNILNILRQVSYTGIIGLGMTFVIISGGIDLSVGSVAAFAGAVGIIALNFVLPVTGNEYLAVLVGITVALLVASLAGALNGFMITRGKIAPFIVTLGTMAIFRSLSLFIGNAGEVRSDSNMYGNFGMNSILFVPVPVFVMLVLAAVLSVVLNQTRYGRYLCAVGSNVRVAAYSAVNVDRIKFMAYTLIGFTVGISAALLSSRFNAVSTSNMGMFFELDAIAAVIIGGTSLFGGKGSIIGTLAGACILQVLATGLQLLGVGDNYKPIIIGAVIILAVIVDTYRDKLLREMR